MFFEDINELINDNDISNKYEGYLRGNMFNDEYVSYKNFKSKMINFNDRKDELLFNISMFEFIMNDLALYLDLHPDDTEIFNYFKDAVSKYKYYLNEYESQYGPLELCANKDNKYVYYKNPWPWDNDGGVKYV